MSKGTMMQTARIEFDFLSQDSGWWDSKLNEVRETGMIGLESGRWTYAGAIGWIRADAARAAEYEKALQDHAHKIALECIGIADTTQVGTETKTRIVGEVVTTETTVGDMLGHRKLKIDTRLKLASKWDRQRYGEHVKVEAVAADPLEGFSNDELRELLAAWRAHQATLEIDVTPEPESPALQI